MIVIAVLVLAAGCSGGADPVSHLKARLHLKEGNRNYLAGRYEKAIVCYDMALRHAPHLAPACLHRAYSLEALFQVGEGLPIRQRLAGEAVESFERYLGLVESQTEGAGSPGPGRERIEERILTLWISSQQLDQAVSHLRARHEKDPFDTSALEMLSRLEMERGRLDEAMQWQRRRVDVARQNPDALRGLGAFVWQMSLRDSGLVHEKRTALLDEGIQVLQCALEARPDDFDALIYINLLYREKAKYAEGEQERREFEARAVAFHDRAVALRRTTAAFAQVGRPSSPGD